MTITLSDEQVEALDFTIGLAVEDQESYLDSGDFSIDYGEDWPEAARSKAAHFRALAEVAEQVKRLGWASTLRELAEKFEQSA